MNDDKAVKEGRKVMAKGTSDQKLIDAVSCMYDGRDEDIRCKTVEFVTVRGDKVCFGRFDKGHEIKSGARMIREKAIVDGDWCTCYTCVDCASHYARNGKEPHAR